MATAADPEPNRSDFSDVELVTPISYRSEEMLLTPVIHACMWCPEFPQYLYEKFNLNKEENVQQEEVSRLIRQIKDLEPGEDRMELLWDKITKFVLKLRIMSNDVVTLLDKIIVNINTPKMEIHGKGGYDISPEKLSMAEEWWRVIEKARKKDPRYKDSGGKSISLLSHINDNIIKGVRNKFMHPTNILPDLKLPGDVRSRLENDFRKLVDCVLIKLHPKHKVST